MAEDRTVKHATLSCLWKVPAWITSGNSGGNPGDGSGSSSNGGQSGSGNPSAENAVPQPKPEKDRSVLELQGQSDQKGVVQSNVDG